MIERVTVEAPHLLDTEMQVMAICLEALKRLPVHANARDRVLSYLSARSRDERDLGKDVE